MYKGQDSDKDYGGWYSIVLAVWIMTGLSWAATMIANLQELYQAVMYPEDLLKEEDEDAEKVEIETINTKVQQVGLMVGENRQRNGE